MLGRQLAYLSLTFTPVVSTSEPSTVALTERCPEASVVRSHVPAYHAVTTSSRSASRARRLAPVSPPDTFFQVTSLARCSSTAAAFVALASFVLVATSSGRSPHLSMAPMVTPRC